MPPPSLSTQTIVNGARAERTSWSEPASCSRARSPVSTTTGSSPASDAPTAEASTPSMPLAPRLDR